MSKVSVVVPIYNAGDKLIKCIKSIINQTFKDFELILVNDGSTDNSLGICEKYKSLDSRIAVIDKVNEGSVATRKRGVEESHSDYIMFVDADDWIDKHTIETLYNNLIHNNVDIVVCNIYKVVGNGNVIKKENDNRYFIGDKLYNEEEVKQELVTAYFYGHPFPSSLNAKLYKKELLLNSGNYVKRIRYLGDDLFYNLEIFLNTKSVKMINKPLYYYRMGGFTSKYMPYLFDDMVNGYQIQKEIIEKYYQDVKEKQYRGITIMLLNTFKTCLYNLFNSNLDESEKRNLIEQYTSNQNVIESTFNDGSDRFSGEYLSAIRDGNIDYLYLLGQHIYKKNKPKAIAKKILAKFV